MPVEFAAAAEKKRAKATWNLLSTNSLVEAVHFARDNGWKDKKVQVRVERGNDYETYYVEPYEKGCGCRGLLKYKEYFD